MLYYFQAKSKGGTMEKIYNKLVRDNIPDIIANDNEEVFTSIMSIEEYQEALLNKLQELKKRKKLKKVVLVKEYICIRL